MSKIKIITDSTSYISKEFVETEGLDIVPLNYIFDEETFKEGFKGEYDDFFKSLKVQNYSQQHHNHLQVSFMMPLQKL